MVNILLMVCTFRRDQVYEYVTAWRNLITTVEMTAILNPSSVKLWFRMDGELNSIEPGQLVQLGA